jgi:hypothetical protein
MEQADLKLPAIYSATLLSKTMSIIAQQKYVYVIEPWSSFVLILAAQGVKLIAIRCIYQEVAR